MHFRMLVLAGVLLGGAGQGASAATVEEVRGIYDSYDVNKAEAGYRDIAADPKGSPRERAAARRELARIAWLVDGERAKALALLESSLPSDPEACEAAVLYGRILNDGPTGRTSALKLAPYAQMCREVDAGVSIEQANAVARQEYALPFRQRQAGAHAALAVLDSVPVVGRDGLQGSRLRLAIGLAAGNTAVALDGWRRWFALSETTISPTGTLPDAAIVQMFGRGARADAAPADAVALAHLLMRTGFYPELKRFVADHGLTPALQKAGPDGKDVTVYLDWRSRLDPAILAHDRRFARKGAGDETAYLAALRQICADAAVALGDANSPPLDVLQAHFGMQLYIDTINNVASILAGHMLNDGHVTVMQDGRSGSVKYAAIDNLVSDGFATWLWDGAQGVGGWTADDLTIVHIREQFLSGLGMLPGFVTPGKQRDGLLADIEAGKARDRLAATKQPVAYFASVRQQLRLHGLEDVAREVRAGLKPGQSFAFEMIKAYYKLDRQRSIMGHEGRHAIDAADNPSDVGFPGDEHEYRAKLSEILYARQPRLALTNIYTSLFGGETQHGQANARIAEDYYQWIKAHPADIAGYDPGLTPLEQLDRLSDEQIRAVVRAVDLNIRACAGHPNAWDRTAKLGCPSV